MKRQKNHDVSRVSASNDWGAPIFAPIVKAFCNEVTEIAEEAIRYVNKTPDRFRCTTSDTHVISKITGNSFSSYIYYQVKCTHAQMNGESKAHTVTLNKFLMHNANATKDPIVGDLLKRLNEEMNVLKAKRKSILQASEVSTQPMDDMDGIDLDGA